MAPVAPLPQIALDQTVCADVIRAIRHEWLVTNGIGGFAMGTVAGALTRRYHGLLVAALAPPLGRTMMAAKLDETVQVAGATYPLAANIWTNGIESPNGCQWLERFELIGGVPTWRYEIGDCALTKRIWMEHGRNVTYVQYEHGPGGRPAELSARVLANHRDYHYLAHRDDWHMNIALDDGELVVTAFPNAVPLRVRCVAPQQKTLRWSRDHTWYERFYLPVEAERGFDHLEDHLCAGHAYVTLKGGDVATFVLATEPDADVDVADAFDRHRRRAAARIEAWRRSAGDAADAAPPSVGNLVLAAHQFIVRRSTADVPDGSTIIAGYPWFSDWGRDTMIALPGLTLCTGREDLAKKILLTWAKYVHEGLVPNRFPDAGDTPEYHTADATLWYLWAIDQYVRATQDLDALAELFPVAKDILQHHLLGTRHNIHIAADGLLHAGADEALNLTWMDAKIGDRVITPRTGKPVELSALWYNALCNICNWAEKLGESHCEFAEMAEHTRVSFSRFWNASRRCLFDVLDGPGGADASLRPNQIFAVALEHSPLTPEQQADVVRLCERELLTPYGLRSLAPRESNYRREYAGDGVARDEAYHTGTAWGWLLGPFVIAHYRVYQDRTQARLFLEPMLRHLREFGVGSLAEIFDGDAPHRPNGTPAQAWTVAETLRAWRLTQEEA